MVVVVFLCFLITRSLHLSMFSFICACIWARQGAATRALHERTAADAVPTACSGVAQFAAKT